MKMKMRIVGLLCLLVAGFMLFGCNTVTTDTTTTTCPSTTTTGTGTTTSTSSTTTVTGVPPVSIYGTITGIVWGINGDPVAGVNVTGTSTSAATNASGWVSLSDVVANTREVISLSKVYYVSAYKVLSVATGEVTYFEAVMAEAPPARTIPTTIEATVSGETSSGITGEVIIPANSLIDSFGNLFTGEASIISTLFDPLGSLEAFPGVFVGLLTSGETVPIQTFGYLNLSMTDPSGNALGVRTGEAITVRMQMNLLLTLEAGLTMPMWYFNPATAQWIESGVATSDGSNLVGVITAPSTISFPNWWNFDRPFTGIAYVSGRVLNSDGLPVQNAEVFCQGNGWSSSVVTDALGNFSLISVLADVSASLFVTKSGQRTTSQIIGPYAAGSINDVGDITFASATLVQMTLTWGANPADLDSHLTIPGTVEGHRWHLYYSNRSSTSSLTWPKVNLDTDDTSSYGPEVVSIYNLYPGTYRYCVHHYSGSSDISSSGANVNLSVSTGGHAGTYNFLPPAGAVGDDDVWEVFDMTVDSSGLITSITTLGTYLNSVSASSHNSFSPNNEETVAYGISGSSVLTTK